MGKKYYLGLDMGTSSVGWAVTDENYNLIRKKGKDLWGVRLFSEAKTAADRRTHRVSRRRLQREHARIGYLRELFADEINKVDPGFYQRLDDSKYFEEDKSIHQPFALFADTGYTDKEYYKEYPTIFHLRKELIQSHEPHDIRLIYLAILNMYKHRGHFLNAGLGDGNIGSLKELFESMVEIAREVFEKEISQPENLTELENILSSKEYSNTSRLEQVLRTLKINKRTDKQQAEFWKWICGLTGTVSIVFPNEFYDEETKKLKISFSDANFDEKCDQIESFLSEESFELFLLFKQLYDWRILSGIMKNGDKTYEYLSYAKVASYEKHKQDLKKLKKLFKDYAPDKYDAMFRVMDNYNYSAYIGSVNSGKEIIRRGGKGNREEFYAKVKKTISHFPESDEKTYILSEIEKGTFLPKQLTASNGVIPNQVHKKELKAILKNAEGYLPFLKEKDEIGLTVSEKIVKFFEFQIPYYVGPLNNTADNHAWSVRKESGRIMPWNFEEKIDIKASSEKFIEQMVNHCTYLNEETVLPKNSLLYERYMVLNELNNLSINGEKISVELKQELYTNLFKNGKKVTGKRLENYLVVHGYVDKDTPIVITGIDGDFTNKLSNYANFARIFNTNTLTREQEQMAEQIIFWSTVYGESKSFLKEKIEQTYGNQLSKEQIKRITGLKFKDWGRFSRQLLELEDADTKMSIISRMWNENYNLMELLGNDFTYKKIIEEKAHKIEKDLTEITYEDLNDLYASAPVKRMIWQTILICKELYQILGTEPKRIFVEMARDTNSEKIRTTSRKKKFAELYKNCKEDGIDWEKKIANTDEAEFRRKKLYLYYTQKGRCMYTDVPIEFSDLFKDNLYDIDHIYPRHFVKDDSIENNLVLVKKEKNAHKSDTFPIENDIRRSRKSWWKSLKDGGFITAEKYNRLTRNDALSDEEKANFISRQIVETRQGTKVITKLLQQTFHDSEIVYVKAGNVSAFRQKYAFDKCRKLNDFHHAQDAYLNIVVGNTYYVKFTKDPRNYILKYNENPKKYAYHMDKIFDYTVSRNGEVAWQTSNNDSIRTVINIMRKNTPLVTRMNYEEHGGLADQTIYSADEAAKAKGIGYIPIKTSESKILDVTKYGGYKKYTGAYFFLIEYEQKGKKIRTLEAMPLYIKEQLNTVEKMEIYCKKQLGYNNPKICMKKIKMYSLIKVDGFFLYLTGRTGAQLLVCNAVQLSLPFEQQHYLKMISSAYDNKLSNKILEDTPSISKEENILLYQTLKNKHLNSIYSKRPNPVGEKLNNWENEFKTLNLDEQIYILLQIIQLSQLINQGADLVKIGGSKATGTTKISKKITEHKEFKLINQSITGLYENEIDLLTI